METVALHEDFIEEVIFHKALEKHLGKHFRDKFCEKYATEFLLTFPHLIIVTIFIFIC